MTGADEGFIACSRQPPGPVGRVAPIQRACTVIESARACAAGVYQPRRFARKQVVARAETGRQIECGEGAAGRAAFGQEGNRIGIGRRVATQQGGVQRATHRDIAADRDLVGQPGPGATEIERHIAARTQRQIAGDTQGRRVASADSWGNRSVVGQGIASADIDGASAGDGAGVGEAAGLLKVGARCNADCAELRETSSTCHAKNTGIYVHCAAIVE